MIQAKLKPVWKENLTHMLGAGSHIPKRQHGSRNRFCSTISSKDHVSMLEMEAAGLVVKGQTLYGGLQFFFATEAGCKAIGLSKAAIKRALKR